MDENQNRSLCSEEAFAAHCFFLNFLSGRVPRKEANLLPAGNPPLKSWETKQTCELLPWSGETRLSRVFIPQLHDDFDGHVRKFCLNWNCAVLNLQVNSKINLCVQLPTVDADTWDQECAFSCQSPSPNFWRCDLICHKPPQFRHFQQVLLFCSIDTSLDGPDCEAGSALAPPTAFEAHEKGSSWCTDLPVVFKSLRWCSRGDRLSVWPPWRTHRPCKLPVIHRFGLRGQGSFPWAPSPGAFIKSGFVRLLSLTPRGSWGQRCSRRTEGMCAALRHHRRLLQLQNQQLKFKRAPEVCGYTRRWMLNLDVFDSSAYAGHRGPGGGSSVCCDPSNQHIGFL